jgi:ribonuclease P protein component
MLRDDLTTHSRARSNTALFRTGGDGNQADLPTFQDAARAAPWVSRAKRHDRWPCSASQPARQRAPSARALAADGKRFGLDAARRLRQKRQFERLLREGRRIKVAGYTFYLESRTAGGPRLGLLVTRTHASRASERNRIKRCIREAFRLEQTRLGPMDVLVRPPYGIQPSAQMISRLRGIFATLSAA